MARFRVGPVRFGGGRGASFSFGAGSVKKQSDSKPSHTRKSIPEIKQTLTSSGLKTIHLKMQQTYQRQKYWQEKSWKNYK